MIRPYIATILIMSSASWFVLFLKIAEAEINKALIPFLESWWFLDAIGGGGWGHCHHYPRRRAESRLCHRIDESGEFFVTTSVVTFILTIGNLVDYWRIILGL